MACFFFMIGRVEIFSVEGEWVAVDWFLSQSLKVTVPVGDPPEPLTVAVKVFDCPKALGLTDELSEVVEDPWLTVCVSVDEVLAATATLPPAPHLPYCNLPWSLQTVSSCEPCKSSQRRLSLRTPGRR